MRADKTQFGAVQKDDPAPIRQKAYYGRDRRGQDVSLDMRDEEGVPMMAFRSGDSLLGAVRADESSSWDRENDPEGQAWGTEYWEAINRSTQFQRGQQRPEPSPMSGSGGGPALRKAEAAFPKGQPSPKSGGAPSPSGGSGGGDALRKAGVSDYGRSGRRRTRGR